MKTHRQALLLLTIGLAALLLAGCTVEVPSLSGMAETEARLTLDAAGFPVAGIDYDPTSKEATWTVVTQSPQSGERVKKGTGVQIVLAGPPPATVPDVVGVSEADASQLLQSAGFILGSVSSSYDESVAVGIITTQSPAPNESMPEGIGVAIVISQGQRPIEVPGVLGEQIDAATAKLESVGFLVNSESKHDGAKKGTVLGQQPSAGQTAQPGATVSLVVSDGVEMVRVPDLLSEVYEPDYDSVVSGLKRRLSPLGLGLSLDSSGRAAYQRPAAGSLVPRGTVVTVAPRLAEAIP